MNFDDTTYQAFLLRIWRIDDGGRSVWRVSLQRPGQEKRIFFSSITDLTLYLTTHFVTKELRNDHE